MKSNPFKPYKSCLVFIIGLLFMIFIVQCGNKSASDKTSNSSATLDSDGKVSSADDTVKLPFIGIRQFETREGVSGTGTPGWAVQIKSNRDVIFSFLQIDQGDDTRPETTGKYYAGKFKKYIKCNFDEWDDFPRYYEITKDFIYEVDSMHKRLYLPECCDDLWDTSCPCKGELWEVDH